ETTASVVPPSRTLRRLTVASFLLVSLPDLFASSQDIGRSCSNLSFAIDLAWRRKRCLRARQNGRRRQQLSACGRRHLAKERQGIASANAKHRLSPRVQDSRPQLLDHSDAEK